jgi:hypothetical protein
MPSSLWFELRDAGCFSNQSSYQRSYDNDRRNYIEARNGCHELHTALNNLRDSNSNNSKDDKEDKDK